MLVTIPETTTVVTGHQGANPPAWLAVYSERDYITGGGTSVVQGSPHYPNSFIKLIPVTVDGLGLVAIPEFALESTEDIDPDIRMTAYFLDENMMLCRPQPFHHSFRVPYIWDTRTWKQLMDGTALPPVTIDAAWSRTQNALQMWDATHGLVDSNILKVGSNAQVTGSLSTSTSFAVGTSATIGTTLGVGGAATFGAGVSAVGTLSGAALAIAGSGSFGNDIAVTDDGVFGGDVHATHFYGDISTATGLPSDEFVGNTWTSATSLGVNYDSDANGSGEFSIARGGVNRLLMANSGFTTFYNGLQGALWDKGGQVFNVKAYGAVGDGVTDDTAAINACLAASLAAGSGRVYFPPSSGRYMTSGGHVLFSGLIIEGQGGAYSTLPFDDPAQPTGSAVIELTDADAEIFFIGEHVIGVTIQHLSMVCELVDDEIVEGTVAIRMRGRRPNSSFNFTIQNNAFRGFDDEISCEDDPGGTPETTDWQCDNVLIQRCDFHTHNRGVYSGTANATNWNFISCKFDTVGEGYACYIEKGAHWNFLECQFIGFGVFPQAAVYLGVNPGYIKLDNCSQEGPDYLIDTEDNPIGNSSAPITIIGSFITQMKFNHSRQLICIGNTFNDPDCIETTANAGDCSVWAVGNSIRGPGASITQQSGSPFGAMTGGGLCITEFNNYNNRLCTSQSGGLTLGGHLGVGTAASSSAAIVRIQQTAAQAAANIPHLRLMSNTSGGITHTYDIYRESGGLLKFVGSQTGSVGFKFNGDVLPDADDERYLGYGPGLRWKEINATVVNSGDHVFRDRATGKACFVVNEDENALYFHVSDEDGKPAKCMGWFDVKGDFYVTGDLRVAGRVIEGGE